MPNVLETSFSFQSAEGERRIDATARKLFDLDAKLNNLGNNINFGGKVSESFSNATKSVDSFQNKVDVTAKTSADSLSKVSKEVDSLKTKIATVAPAPTISRYWQNEEEKVKVSVKNINAETSSLNLPRNNPGKDSLDRLTGRATPTPTRSNPLVDTAKLFGESRFNEPVLFRKIDEEARKATASVANLRRGTTEFQRTLLELTDDFVGRGFNRPFNAVGREVFSQFNASNGEAGIQSAGGVEKIAALTRVKQANLAVTKAETALTEASALASTGDATAKALVASASTSLTAAKRAETAATASLTAATNASTVSVIGFNTATLLIAAPFVALIAAGAAVVSVTKSIREESERRLATENKISAAVNKQIFAQIKLNREFKEGRESAERARNFGISGSQNGISDTLEELKRRKANAERVLSFLPQSDNPDDKVSPLIKSQVDSRKAELASLEAQIFAKEQQLINSPNENFNQRNENFKKLQETARQNRQTYLTQNRDLDDQEISQTLAFQKSLSALNNQNNPIKAAQDNLKAETESTQNQIRVLKKFRFDLLSNLSTQDLLSGKGTEIDRKTTSEISRLESQLAISRLNTQKEINEQGKKFFEDYKDSLISLRSVENPLVKQFFEIETATERAQKKFGQFGASVVNQIASIEKANLNKAIGLEKFQNSFDALKLRQDAFKLQNTPERQFADSQRNIETVSKTAEFVTAGNDLDRKVQEARFFAETFNPNNPKSFNQFNRRGVNDDISDVGIQIRNAVKDISDLQKISLSDTGTLGKGLVADKILSTIPSRDELLRRLGNPQQRGDAQFLLSQQAEALTAKRDAERQKFNEFLDDQRLSQFAKGFAKDQIGLINRDLGLTDDEKAKRRLSVTDALGNDLDADLRRGRINDFIQTANAKDKLAADAMKIASDTKDAVEALLKLLKDQGIKIDNDGKEPQGVTVTVIDNTTGGGVEAGLVPAPNTNNQTVNSTFFQDAGF